MRAPDDLFADARLAAIYDVFEGDRDDLDHYEAIVTELGARSVLDIGCGTGEFACRLARSGHTMVGLDPALASIEIARTKPGAKDVRWIVGDATELPPMQVDVATMTANVAQVFITDHDWMATLTATAAALQPGGHVVFETRRHEARAWERWVPQLTRQSVTVPSGETVETWCDLLDVAGDLVSFRWTTVFGSDDATLTSDSTLRFRSRDEIVDHLAAAHFAVVDVREAPDRPGEEMVFIARRT